MNLSIITGRLATEPKAERTAAGHDVIKFRVAVEAGPSGETIYYTASAFAKRYRNYLSRARVGDNVTVVGNSRLNAYIKDGQAIVTPDLDVLELTIHFGEKQ